MDQSSSHSKAVCKPHGIQTVSIIGAGVMGRGIALANVNAGIRVRLFDVDESVATTLVNQIRHCSPLITVAKTDAEIANADLIIEAVSESAALKTALYSRLEPFLQPETLVASNSSSIPISRLAANLSHPARFCGMHFCHPVNERPLVEVIGATTTHPDTLSRIHSYATSLGMTPIFVQDTPGFLLNRLLVTYLNEALELLLDRVEINALDAAALQFGFPIGPLAQLDAFGLDVAVEVGKTLYWNFPDRIVPSGLLIAMYKAGRRGCKTKSGFYVDQPGLSQTIDPAVQVMIEERYRDTAPVSPEVISHRLLLPLLLEATRTLEESIVSSSTIIDAALRDGLGMTRQYTGLFAWADSIGAATLLEWLTPLQPLGKRFEPTQALLDVAAGKVASLTRWKPTRKAA